MMTVFPRRVPAFVRCHFDLRFFSLLHERILDLIDLLYPAKHTETYELDPGSWQQNLQTLYDTAG